MIGLGFSQKEVSQAIDDAYNLKVYDVPVSQNTAVLDSLKGIGLISSDDKTTEGPISTYVGTPTLGRNYRGKNPNLQAPTRQTLKRLILYAISLSRGELVFRQNVHNFDNEPTETELRDTARKLYDEDFGSFKTVDPRDLVWDAPCYLGFVMSDHRCKFLTDANGKANAIHFPDGEDRVGSPKRDRMPNKTCFGSKIVKLRALREMLLVENHHLFASDGTERPPKTGNSRDDFYKFDIYIMVEFDDPSVSLPVIIDPGARNTGP